MKMYLTESGLDMNLRLLSEELNAALNVKSKTSKDLLIRTCLGIVEATNNLIAVEDDDGTDDEVF